MFFSRFFTRCLVYISKPERAMCYTCVTSNLNVQDNGIGVVWCREYDMDYIASHHNAFAWFFCKRQVQFLFDYHASSFCNFVKSYLLCDSLSFVDFLYSLSLVALNESCFFHCTTSFACHYREELSLDFSTLFHLQMNMELVFFFSVWTVDASLLIFYVVCSFQRFFSFLSVNIN